MSSMSSLATLRQFTLASHESRSLPTLGSLSWWSIEQVEITRQSLQSLFAQFSLPEDWLPNPIEKRTAFLRAARDSAGALPNGKRLIVTKVVHNQDEIKFAFTIEEIIEKKPVFTPANEISLLGPGETANVLVSAPDGQPSEAAFMDRYNRLCLYYTSEDIRSMILNIIKRRLGGIGLRPNGGIYFTSRDFDEQISRLENLTLSLGSSVYYSLGIIDVPKARANMFAIFKAEMTGELDTISEEITKLLDNKTTRPATLARYLKEFERAREKAEMYEKLLEIEAREIHERISCLEERIRCALV